MIRVHKPTEAPSPLRVRGAELTGELCRRVDEDDSVDLTFDSKVYGATEVKETLIRAQHDKCCFCESKISHVAFGDVEHFRPKKAVRPSADQPMSKPGYYWLAYSWSNLFLACEPCNRRHKQSLFPLENEAHRVRSHRDADDLAREQPLFVDPGRDDPTEHIGFRRAYAHPVAGSARGPVTIKELDLNRKPLRDRRIERRESLLSWLRSIRAWIAQGCPEPERRLVVRIAATVLAVLRDDAEYAAMNRALVRKTMHGRELDPTMDPAAFLAQLERDAEQGQWLAIPPH